MTNGPIKASSAAIASIENLCSALSITVGELEFALAIPDSEKYTRQEIPKKDGTSRVVYNPVRQLRRIQRRINNRIFAAHGAILWPIYLFGSIPNGCTATGEVIPKDYVACARMHCLARSILSVDIKDFFDNISQEAVKDIFISFFKYPESVAATLADLCCFERRVVQGALTSSYIASLCLHDVEGRLYERLKRKGLVYTRLVDDITISSRVSNYNFDYARKAVEEVLFDKELPLNIAKTRVQYMSTTPLMVHGLRVAFASPRLPSDEVRRIRAAVKNVETIAKEGNYRMSHSYRKDFNRCMGRVNKLSRVGHRQHRPLVDRLKKILPLPSKKDIERVGMIISRLERDHATKGDTYWYWKRFYLAHERINVLQRTYPAISREYRKKLKVLKSTYE